MEQQALDLCETVFDQESLLKNDLIFNSWIDIAIQQIND